MCTRHFRLYYTHLNTSFTKRSHGVFFFMRSSLRRRRNCIKSWSDVTKSSCPTHKTSRHNECSHFFLHKYANTAILQSYGIPFIARNLIYVIPLAPLTLPELACISSISKRSFTHTQHNRDIKHCLQVLAETVPFQSTHTHKTTC